MLIYRGAWCPYCQAQLAGFQRASEKLAEAGIKVVALSVDNEATTVGTIEKFKLSFSVGHSADADKVASITGAYTNESPHYLQTTGFLLAPDGKILNAVYSSGPIGRLVAEDILGVDSDLNGMSREQLIEEVKRLRAGIRAHRDSSGHDLCWHHPQLWGLLPERIDPEVAVPPWPKFMRGCVAYRASLDRELKDAPIADVEFGGSA